MRGAVDERTSLLARDSWWGDDSRWYPGGTPPRSHNRVTPLIDGEAFFGALYEALTQAKTYVYIAGWCLTPYVGILTVAAGNTIQCLEPPRKRGFLLPDGVAPLRGRSP